MADQQDQQEQQTEQENAQGENQGDNTGANDNGAAPEVDNAQVEKFEKVFRLLDSPVDGEAESAFRMARKQIGKIGLTFAGLLEMINAGGSSDEMRQLLEQYKDANEQLAMAQDTLLLENKRLNLLLKYFHDKKVELPRILNIGSVKKKLAKMAPQMKAASDEISALQMQDEEKLNEVYRQRVAEATLPHKGHAAKNFGDRIILGAWKSLYGRDLSDENILRLQDLVTAQENVLGDKNNLAEKFIHMVALSQQMVETVDLILSGTTPKALFEDALNQLKDLQIRLGEIGPENTFLKAQNEQMERQLEAATLMNYNLSEQVSNLQEMVEYLNSSEAQRKFRQADGTYEFPFDMVEVMTEVQAKEIIRIHRQMAQVQAKNILSPTDMMAVTALQTSNTLLEKSVETLDKLAEQQQLAIDEDKKDRGWWARFFNSTQRDLKHNLSIVKQVIEQAEKVGLIIPDLINAVDKKGEEIDENNQQMVEGYSVRAKDSIQEEFNNHINHFSEIQEERESTATKAVKKAEKSLKEKTEEIKTLNAEIEKLQKAKANQEVENVKQRDVFNALVRDGLSNLQNLKTGDVYAGYSFKGGSPFKAKNWTQAKTGKKSTPKGQSTTPKNTGGGNGSTV